MATDDLTYGGTLSRLPSDNDRPAVVHASRTRDFSVAANSVSNADILQMIHIPAGFYMMGAYCKTITAETSTAQLGDGADVNGWLGTTQCDLNSTSTDVTRGMGAGAATVVNQYAAQGGKYYPVADTLDLIPTNTLNSAKVKVGYWGFMMNKADVAAA
jgi:hypothetical protein